jgi:outer membrane protein OmpA-like peptidoglycan-associated protein/tetratricopeptide (TPR) repeat protein
MPPHTRFSRICTALLLAGLWFLAALPDLKAQARTANELVKDAQKELSGGNLAKAEDLLKEAIKLKEGFAAAHRMLGSVYAKQLQCEKAIKAYERTIALQPNFSRTVYFECAENYMKTGDYPKALEYLEFYRNAASEDFKAEEANTVLACDEKLERVAASCRYALNAPDNGPAATALPLGDSLNTARDDYMPAVSTDGQWLAFTRKYLDEDIFFSRKKGGNWSAPQPAQGINTEFNEGMARFAGCGNSLYFTGCNRGDGRGSCDIYLAEWSDEEPFVPQSLNGALNLKSWDSQPCLSCDGSLMVFASNREGGFGGADLWYSRLLNGTWSDATNLGPIINTKGDEESPFLAPDGQTLYFSSDGHPGFGEADIFRALSDANGVWTTVENMGRTVNTAFRETGFCLSPDQNEAYFASARPGGMGGLDLYRAAVAPPLLPLQRMARICGTVTDATGTPLAGATLRIRLDGKDLRTVASDADGYVAACVPNAAYYSLLVEKKGYESHIGAEYLESTPARPVFRLDVALAAAGPSRPMPQEPRRPVPPPVQPPLQIGPVSGQLFFEQGSTVVPESERRKLLQLAGSLGVTETIRAEVVGYADELADPAQNQQLSVRRAENVARLLESLGVPKAHIQLEGRGGAAQTPGTPVKRYVEVQLRSK